MTMKDNIYPQKEQNNNQFGEVPYIDNETQSIQPQPQQPVQPQQQTPPPNPINPPKTPATEEDYINSLQPASYTAYSPGTIDKANEIYNQSFNDYINGISDESIISKSKKLMDFYNANKPDPEKSMSDFDNRVKGTLLAKALGDLTTSIGSVAGNKGGMAHIKDKNFSAFDNAYNAHMNAVKEKGVRDYNQKVQDFQTMLDQMAKENQMLNNRDASALEYAEKARENYKGNNKVTYNNSAALQKEKIEADTKRKELDRKNNIDVAKIRSKGDRARARATIAEIVREEKEKTLSNYENIFKNGIEALRNGKLVKSTPIIYVDKNGKKIGDTGKRQQQKFTEKDINAIEDIWYKSSNKRDAIMKLEMQHPEIFNFGKNATDAQESLKDFFVD